MTTFSTEELARGVARALEEDGESSELERLTRGTLDSQTRDRLERTSINDPGLRGALLAYEPLSEAAHDRIAARVLEELGDEALPNAQAPSRPHGARDVAPTTQRRSLGSLAWFGAPLLAAAAVALVMLRSPEIETIRRYRVELPPAASETRDTPASSNRPILRPAAGKELELVLRPDVLESGAIAVFAYLQEEQRLPTPLALTVDRAASGVLRLSLPLPNGITRGRMIFLVGRPEALSSPHVLDGEAAGRGWQRLEVPYAIQ